MSKPNTRGRGRRKGLVIAGIVVLVVAGLLVTARLVGGEGYLTRVFAGGEEKKSDDAHQGKVAVLVSPVVLQPFTTVDPNGLIDPKTGDYYVGWVSEKIAVEDKMVRDPNMLRGRVLCREKQPWRAFSEADFYPVGSRPSPTSGIKPGRRGLSLSPEKIEGLAPLRYGDRFDLVAVKSKNDSGVSDPSNYVDPSLVQRERAEKGWAADQKILAEDVEVLIPLPAPGPGQQGARTVFVSLRDEDATAVALAIEKSARISVLARSGVAGAPVVPLPEPEEPVKTDTIKVTNGGTTSTTTTPARAPDPAEATAPVGGATSGAQPNSSTSGGAVTPAPGGGAVTPPASSGAIATTPATAAPAEAKPTGATPEPH